MSERNIIACVKGGRDIMVKDGHHGAELPVVVECFEKHGLVHVDRVKYDGTFIAGAIAMPSRLFLGWLERQVTEHLAEAAKGGQR